MWFSVQNCVFIPSMWPKQGNLRYRIHWVGNCWHLRTRARLSLFAFLCFPAGPRHPGLPVVLSSVLKRKLGLPVSHHTQQAHPAGTAHREAHWGLTPDRDIKQRKLPEDVGTATVPPHSGFMLARALIIIKYKALGKHIGRWKKLAAQKSVTLYGAGIYSSVLLETTVITTQRRVFKCSNNLTVGFCFITVLPRQRNLSKRVFQQHEPQRCQKERQTKKQNSLLSGYCHFCMIIHWENRLGETVKEFSFITTKPFQRKDKLTELLQML